jgi:hypothetical protein
MDYCVQDCVALLDTWRSDIGWLESDIGLAMTHNGTARTTIGSVAWATASGMVGPGILDSDPEELWARYDAGRRAYYGGRVEVGRVYAPSGHRYDVHSMYPWALRHSVPIGEMTACQGSYARSAYRRGEPGAYYARLSVPGAGPPLLPMRAGRGEAFADTHEDRDIGPPTIDPGRLIWATGTIEGWYTGLELERVEARGAKIESLTAGKIWSDAAPIYAPYVESVYNARERAKIDAECGETESIRTEGDRRAALLKWFANALSGKLAQGTEVETAYVSDLDPDAGVPEGSHWGGGRVNVITHERMPSSGYPIQAAYVTARSRIRLLDRIARAGSGFIYCDTDSVYSVDPDPADVHPSRLGSWGYEGSMTDWIAIAPKVYTYLDGEGRARARAKGVPLADREDVLTLRDGGRVEARVGVETLRTGDGAFRARTVTRTSRGARVWAGLRYVDTDTGVTYPPRRGRDGLLSVP